MKKHITDIGETIATTLTSQAAAAGKQQQADRRQAASTGKREDQNKCKLQLTVLCTISKQKTASNHLNSWNVWISMFVKAIDKSRQNMVNSQCAVVEHNYQSFVLLFTHIHNHLSCDLCTLIIARCTTIIVTIDNLFEVSKTLHTKKCILLLTVL